MIFYFWQCGLGIRMYLFEKLHDYIIFPIMDLLAAKCLLYGRTYILLRLSSAATSVVLKEVIAKFAAALNFGMKLDTEDNSNNSMVAMLNGGGKTEILRTTV